jgi:hypothetical protein
VPNLFEKKAVLRSVPFGKSALTGTETLATSRRAKAAKAKMACGVGGQEWPEKQSPPRHSLRKRRSIHPHQFGECGLIV